MAGRKFMGQKKSRPVRRYREFRSENIWDRDAAIWPGFNTLIAFLEHICFRRVECLSQNGVGRFDGFLSVFAPRATCLPVHQPVAGRQVPGANNI